MDDQLAGLVVKGELAEVLEKEEEDENEEMSLGVNDVKERGAGKAKRH